MNKKFSTLVASLLLVAGSAAYTPVYADDAVSGPIKVTESVASGFAPKEVTAYDEATNRGGGYQVGKSYFLGADISGTTNYLYVEGKTLKLGSDVSSITKAEKALWTLTSINAPVGAIAPQYTFVNKATGVVLAMDPSKAVSIEDIEKGVSTLGGSQTEWLQALSYRDPAESEAPIYAAVKDDEVIALATKADGSTVTLVKMTKAELDTKALQVKPYVVGTTNNVFTLSPNELNTMLGKAGATATKDNFFSLNFNPAATVNGERNIWADDLQAVAVEQFELAYGQDPEKANWMVEGDGDLNGADPGIVKAGYASLYPSTDVKVTDKGTGTYKARTEKDSDDPRFLANEDSYRESAAQWVALRNREGKFLVVDTAYVTGTGQESSPRITFTYDDLYNARTETRFRNPQSYLFRFDYNPVTGTVEIQSMAYIEKVEVKDGKVSPTIVDDAFGEGITEAAFYEKYDKQAKKLGSCWTGATDGNVSKNKSIIRVALGPVTEVSLGTLAGDNRFSITLGNAAAYVPTIKANTAYLLKIAGSTEKSNIGKYIVDNLVGGMEIMQQAKRQNFQHMPAAQWILTSPTTTAGAPVTLTNREFLNMYATNATLFAVEGQPNQAFFMGGDTLEFIPVTSLNDKYLGYKYVADDSIAERTFTFNYLHELKMNCPINTKDTKDSVVWVDVDGNAINFVLEKVLDDSYGTNCGLSTISPLTRRVYAIKVNDASKLQNDKRYLAYDANQKKYILSTSAKAHFFLKENNEVEGGECYYTLIEPYYMKDYDHFIQVKGDGSTDNQFEKSGTLIDDNVFDNDALGAFVAYENANYLDPETGLDTKRWEVRVFTFDSQDKYDEAVKNLGKGIFEYVSFPEAGKVWANNNKDFAIRVKLNTNVAGRYAQSKLSVDNNTLDLVNGVLSDGSWNEVANSAFAVVVNNDPLYRRFNTELEGLATDAPDTVKFYRVNATAKEYLYEDATSKYSKDKEFNFLGVEDKGVLDKNAAIFVDTAYVRGNTSMPQYLLALRPTIVAADTVLCDATTHKHETEADRLACPHTSITKGYVDAWYLVNLQDSVNVHEGLDAAKYQWNNAYTRLGFVQARHIDDTLVIKNSIYTGNNKPIEIGKAATWAGKDSIFLGDNKHKNVAFSFRLVKSGSNDFLIESEGDKIAPEKGGWIKIQNGVPVIAKYETYNEAGRDAEIFNVEKTAEQPTANESMEASKVTVTTGAGAVIVENAAGKKVTVSNLLGKTIATVVLTSDKESIAVPAEIVIVAVEGEDAVKTVVK